MVGLLVALLVIVSVPVRVPDAVGRKLTLTVQDAPAAIERAAGVGLQEVTGDRDAGDRAPPPCRCWSPSPPARALVVLSAWVAKVSEDGLVLRVAEFGGVPPLG